MKLLKDTFIDLVGQYTDDKPKINGLWAEIEAKYTSKKRHYHTLSHLDNLLTQLDTIKDAFLNWESIKFSIYYHDIIYNSLKSDNEKKSADLAKNRMKQILVSDDVIDRCEKQILATKKHEFSSDSDINYFLDADLSILGMEWEIYTLYYKNVRKEYSIYPDLIYNPGRKKVLIHFLNMDRVFKTDIFYKNYEYQAKVNRQRELELL